MTSTSKAEQTPSGSSSPSECPHCGHEHLRNTHTCGWPYSLKSSCECKGFRQAVCDHCEHPEGFHARLGARGCFRGPAAPAGPPCACPGFFMRKYTTKDGKPLPQEPALPPCEEGVCTRDPEDCRNGCQEAADELVRQRQDMEAYAQEVGASAKKPDFKPGDRVRDSRDQTVTINRGPLRSWCGDLYEVGGVPGGVEPWIEHGESLEPIPADPRVEIAARAVANVDNNGPSEFAVQESDRQIARAVFAALDAETDGPLVQVGWYCWRGSGHLAAMACKSDSVPIYVPKEWEKEMRGVMDDE